MRPSRTTWGEDSLDYATETALPDGGLLLEDLNFDGYLDIALQGWTAVGNRPYYLWFCDLDRRHARRPVHLRRAASTAP